MYMYVWIDIFESIMDIDIVVFIYGIIDVYLNELLFK